MMKQATKIILFFLLLVEVSSLYSQSQIQGVVQEFETGEPVLFGTVALYKYGVLLTGTQTDFDGQFVFSDITPGIYLIEVSYVGMKRATQEVEITKDKVYQKIISMKYENMDGCGIVTTSCSFYDPQLFAHDQFTQGTILYPNRRPLGKTYVLFKNKLSTITARIKREDINSDLSGEVRVYNNDQLVKTHRLSQGSIFKFYSLKKGKYRVEVNALGYEQEVINFRLRRGKHKEVEIQLKENYL